MARWWSSTTLIAVCLAGAPAAQAQYLQYASPPPMPEPVPTATMIPGPLNSLMAPQGPCDDMALPGNYPNSFTGYEEPKPPDKEWYFNVGLQALVRQRPTKHFPLAILDPQNLDTGKYPFILDVHDAQKFGDLQPNWALGVRTALIYRWDNHEIEVSGFYQPDNKATKESVIPGRLDLSFFNPPLGFEGDNGMWLQVDRLRTILSTSLGSAEVNYHQWSDALTGVEWILGVRYFNLNEHLTIFTDDDGVKIRDVFGFPDPLRQAYYILHARNNLVAPQAGLEYDWKLTDWLVLNCYGKGAWGVNFTELDSQLVRGDGLRGRMGKRSDTSFAHMYDIGMNFDIYLAERIRWRLGYTWFILCHALDVANEVDFDLSHSINDHSEFKNIFFHGPVFEFQFVF